MRKSLLFSFAFLILAGMALAQDRTVSGKVTSAEDGSAIPGVNIVVKGTTTGTVTDIDGNYNLSVGADENTLIFSFIGMETQEVEIGTRSNINLTMASDAEQLAEVVVTGYGTATRESLTGSIGELTSDQLQQVPMASFEQAIQGNIAGVQSIGIDGAPGANTQIRVRGIGSITASSEPLYVIDGIPVQSGDITNLNGNGGRSGNVMAAMNPNDIESVTVLKDAASTAIYGSRGANGVILITTKSGKTGKAKIDFRALVGFNDVAGKNLMKPLNRVQYHDLFVNGYINDGDTPQEAQDKYDNRFEQLTDPSTGQLTDTNWQDELLRTGITQSYDLSGSGASENLNYFFSAGYYDQESHVIGSNFERLTARVNLNYKANDFISISNNLFVSNFIQNGYVDGSAWANPLYNAILLAPVIPVKDDQGRFNAEHKNYFPMGGNNPVGKLSGDDLRETKQIRILDNFAVTVSFLDNFKFRSQWNFDVISIDESQYENPRYGNGRNSGGQAQNSTVLNSSWVGTQTLNYGITLANAHNIDAIIGYEAQKSTEQVHSGYGNQFPNDKLRTLNSTAAEFSIGGTRTEYTFASIFGRVNYDYNSKYFISGSIRRDGSSRFGANNRWGTFYSVGGAWLANNEGFLSNVSAIDLLKIRTSFGVTGNAAIGNFPSVGLYTYGQDYDGNPGGRPEQIANPDLTWETQENFNVGIDFNIFSRVSGTFEYFNKVSSDLILNVPISRTTGFTDLTQNFGEMKNTGYEITLSGQIIDVNEFSWSLGFNMTFLKNELTKLTEDFNDGTKRRQEGSDYQSYYLNDWAGVDQTNGEPLWFTDSTRSETTNNISNAERFMLGKSATPDHYGGFNTTFSWKGISLFAQFNYSYGNYIYHSNGRHLMGDGRLTPRSTTTWAYENMWVPGKTDALLPQHIWGGQNGSSNSSNSRWLYDASYMRLRNLTVTYDFPVALTSKMKMRSVRVYLRGTNVLTFTKDKDLYLDPEQAVNGVANGMTPAARTFAIGIDLGL